MAYIKLSKEIKEKNEIERRRKISETMKKRFIDGIDDYKRISQYAKNKMKERGYVNSPEARKKVSNSLKEMWKEGNVTDKQKNTLFKKGIDNRRISTQFKDGHEVTEKTREAVKESRKKQIFPIKDSLIEVKIQNFLKQLEIPFFTHQYMNIEHGYQCDILVPSMNLVIECDGNYWHKYPTGRDIDNIRTKELIENGFKVLRLWEINIKSMNLNNFKEFLNGN